MQNQNEDLNLPDPLKQELRNLYAPGTSNTFTHSRDAAILAAARAAGARSKSQTFPWRRLSALGIAAAVALAAGVLWHQFTPTPHDQRVLEMASLPADPDATYTRTGDIRDAFYLARRLKSNQPLDTAWDTNHDGLINDADVQSLALAAVKLDRTPATGRTQ